MHQGLLILPVAAPVFFCAAYHYYKAEDIRWKQRFDNFKRSLKQLDDAVALAADNGTGLFAYAMLGIGPIEELAKLIPFLLVVVRFKAFDDPMDGIIYASFIALGYAAVENYHYLDFLTTTEAFARGFAAPVIHIVFASIWAHWITRARLGGKSITRPAFLGFLVAACLHGFYDFLVLRHAVLALPIAATLIATIWIWRLRLMQDIHDQADRQKAGRSLCQGRCHQVQ